MAVECEFQALMLAEAREEIQAYEARSHKSIRGGGWPMAMKPKEFQQKRGKNRWSDSYDGNGDYAPRWVALDWNNTASG